MIKIGDLKYGHLYKNRGEIFLKKAFFRYYL